MYSTSKIKYLLLVLITLMPTTISNQSITDSQRTETVIRVCQGASRSQLFQYAQSIDRTLAQDTIHNVYQDFKSVPFIQDLIKGEVDADRIGKEVRQNVPSIVVGLGFFVVPIVVLIFLLPALCCCCCCPDTCPVCCRQPQDREYTDCQRACPAFFIIVFCGLILTAAIIGLAWRQSVQNTYDHVRCSAAIVIDDIINGNKTLDGEGFFIGIQTLVQQLEELSSNMGQIQSQLNDTSSDGNITSQVLADFDDAMTQVQNIPDTNASNLQYSSPLNQVASGSFISSTFPNQLQALIYNQYQALQSAQTQVNVVVVAADVFEATVGGFNSGFSQVDGMLDPFIEQANQIDQDIDQTFTNIQNDIVNIIVIVVYVIFGILIVFSVFAIVASFCMGCCGTSSCRYLLYTGCVCLSLMAFICFIVATAFAVLAPVSYFACDFIETSLESKEGFQTNVGPIIDSDFVTDLLTQCLPSQSGQIIKQLIGDDIYDTITSIDDVIDQLTLFNGINIAKDLQDGYINVTPRIGQYLRSEVIDIDTSADSSLNRISNSSQYPGCSAPGFDQDSWIPSVTSQTSVPCLVSGNDTTHNTCTSVSDLQSRASGCTGCIDTFLIFSENGLTSYNDVLTSLSNRYPGCGSVGSGNVTDFNIELGNVWQNFYKVKLDTIGPVESRSQNADIVISRITDSIRNDVDPLFSNTLTSLNDQVSSIIDEDYGIIAGINCRPLFQDAQILFNTFCNDAIILSVFMQIAFGLMGYLIMIIACCSVCLGVRHYRKEQRQNNILYFVGGNANSDQKLKVVVNKQSAQNLNY